MTEAVFVQVGGGHVSLFKLAEAVEVYVNELRAVVEFYFGETTFIFGINLLVAVPTTLRSVWFASYRSSKRLPAAHVLAGCPY